MPAPKCKIDSKVLKLRESAYIIRLIDSISHFCGVVKRLHHIFAENLRLFDLISAPASRFRVPPPEVKCVFYQ